MGMYDAGHGCKCAEKENTSALHLERVRKVISRHVTAVCG